MLVGWFGGCLTSQQHARVSQGRICSDNFTCCHTDIDVADQTFHLTQSQYTDTGLTSPSADPITPGAWQGSQWHKLLSAIKMFSFSANLCSISPNSHVGSLECGGSGDGSHTWGSLWYLLLLLFLLWLQLICCSKPWWRCHCCWRRRFAIAGVDGGRGGGRCGSNTGSNPHCQRGRYRFFICPFVCIISLFRVILKYMTTRKQGYCHVRCVTEKKQASAMTRSHDLTGKKQASAMTRSHDLTGKKQASVMTRSHDLTGKKQASVMTRSHDLTKKKQASAMTRSHDLTEKKQASAMTRSHDLTGKKQASAMTRSYDLTKKKQGSAMTRSHDLTKKKQARAMTRSHDLTGKKQASVMTRSHDLTKKKQASVMTEVMI